MVCVLRHRLIFPHLPYLSINAVQLSYERKMILDPNKHCSSLDTLWNQAQKKESFLFGYLASYTFTFSLY